MPGHGQDVDALHEERPLPATVRDLPGERDGAVDLGEGLVVAITAPEQVDQVVGGSRRRGGNVVLDRKLQRVSGQRERLLRPALTVSNIGLADESVREQAREPVRLGDRQGGLHTLFGQVELAGKK